MDKFTPDILILGYSGNNTEVRLVSRTGLSPAVVGCSKAVLLPHEFVTSYEFLISCVMCPHKIKNSNVLPLLPFLPNNCLLKKKFRLGRVRSPLLTASNSIYFPLGTEMFHFPRYAPRLRGVIVVHTMGLPHSDITGS